jgi:hypothetical protein
VGGWEGRGGLYSILQVAALLGSHEGIRKGSGESGHRGKISKEDGTFPGHSCIFGYGKMCIARTSQE